MHHGGLTLKSAEAHNPCSCWCISFVLWCAYRTSSDIKGASTLYRVLTSFVKGHAHMKDICEVHMVCIPI